MSVPPGQPAAPTVTAGNGGVIVAFVAPDDGGSTILEYEVAVDLVIEEGPAAEAVSVGLFEEGPEAEAISEAFATSNISGRLAGVGTVTATLTRPGPIGIRGRADGVGTLDALLRSLSLPQIVVRERPPLRLHIEAIAPGGKHYRWGEDERNPANVPSGLRHSSTMPGGYESLDVSLPRKPGLDYSDLARLTKLRLWGAGADLVGEYRLERTPRVSGDQMLVSPSAVGYQAQLEDDQNASMIFIDRDLGKWSGAPAVRRTQVKEVDGYSTTDPSVNDATLQALVTGPWTAASKALCEAWYDAGPGVGIGRVDGTWFRSENVDAGDPNWNWAALLSPGIDLANIDTSGPLRAVGPAAASVVASGTRRYAVLQFFYAAAATDPSAENVQWSMNWMDLSVIGNHGIAPATDSTGALGFYASDMVKYIVGRWAPGVTFDDDTVIRSQFVVPQATFANTTGGEMLRNVTRYGLQDWAVWGGPQFWWYPRGTFGRAWRTRLGPAQLEETGPQVDRLWESVVVEYQDVDGTTRTVGPPGSGADTEDAALKDADPDNPANILGITRRQKLAMNGVGTAAAAVQIGFMFLQQSKLLDGSGRASLVGHVEDDRGVLHPYWRVRAGDSLSIVDAADSSPRRIVKAEHDRSTRTVTVDLDSPPDSMSALLERLQVSLPTGVR